VGQGDDVTVQRPDLGVVVPVYNGERWLRAALESLQEQTLADWEAVVVDDGSTDDTLRLAQEITAGDTRFRVVSQPNAGVAVARNVGLAQLAEGIRFVAFLDADDRYEPAALGLLRATLDARPEAVGAYCLARYVDAEGVPILVGRHEAVQRDRRRVVGRRVVSADAEVDLAFDSLIVSNAIWPAAVALLRRGDLLALGGADPSFQVQEDWELYLRRSRACGRSKRVHALAQRLSTQPQPSCALGVAPARCGSDLLDHARAVRRAGASVSAYQEQNASWSGPTCTRATRS